ncbi:MAG: DUF2577 domain-containing protein [Bacteroidaceae bacterium]|nr:DUF2577 domain-containing protein [Bacteroidaceae bacterium]
MPDSRLANAIKQLAQQTQDASKPVERVFGVVTNIDPFTIQVNEKLILDGNFLAITQTVKNYLNWEYLGVGDKVVMTRQSGGQLYIVDDMLASGKSFDKLVMMNHTHNYEVSGSIKTTTKGERPPEDEKVE